MSNSGPHNPHTHSPSQSLRAQQPQIPTLHSFLHAHHLGQFYRIFLDAGCTEYDVAQFLQFNDEEIKEFALSVKLKPFPTIAFKKGLRELKELLGLSVGSVPTLVKQTSSMSLDSLQLSPSPPSPSHPEFPRKRLKSTDSPPSPLPSLSRTVSCPLPISTTSTPPTSAPPTSVPPTSRETLIEHATIYGKKVSRPLTGYEQAINNAAITLALADPALIAKKGTLFEKAKTKLLDEGYTYKRGASRSKLNPAAPKPGQRTSKDKIRFKRNQNAAMTSESRLQRIAELEERVNQLERDREQADEIVRASAGRDVVAVEAAQRHIQERERERAQLIREISTLKSKERKHQWYEKRKKERGDSGFAEEDIDDNASSFFASTKGSSIVDEDDDGNKSDGSERASVQSSQDPEMLNLELSAAQTLGTLNTWNSSGVR